VGWGRARHADALARLIRSLEEPERPSRRDEARDELPPEERTAARERRLSAARLAARFAARAVALAPPEDSKDALRAVARGVLDFVREFARVTDDLDAAARTALETLFREIAELPAAPVPLAEALGRLQDAVRELAVSPDRPRAGRVHVAPFASGGHSGRRHALLVGLDATRHPGADLEDPVLLDDERRRINEALERPLLAIERERPRDHARALEACVARLRGSLTASYSKFDILNLSQAGEPPPAPFFLELYRRRAGRADADYTDMLDALPPACGFVPEPGAALDDAEWWLGEIRRPGAALGGAAGPLVRAAYPWLEDGLAAATAREGDAFTRWDGRLAGPAPELDPRVSRRPMSASRIQDLARCPFSYFVRTVLRAEPPEDLERDPTRWLEPRDEGSLLHEVFRAFLERVTARGEKPDADRHREELLAIAGAAIEAWRERVPPSSQVAFEAQREAIEQACWTFLRAETEHCRGVTPRFFEVSFGMRDVRGDGVASAEPVEIALPDGRPFLLRGSIDRVDEGEPGAFQVWDYKTGSAAGIREGRGLDGGRQAQPSLYALAFESLLRRRGTPGRVVRSGYFFPGRKGEGQRVTIPVDAAETGRALARLFDLAGAGFFPHTASKEGCRFCVVESVCGGAVSSSVAAERKLGASTDPTLTAFRQLHGFEDD
jgi:ATP-dependent helicase/nuclease subunit B